MTKNEASGAARPTFKVAPLDDEAQILSDLGEQMLLEGLAHWFEEPIVTQNARIVVVTGELTEEVLVGLQTIDIIIEENGDFEAVFQRAAGQPVEMHIYARGGHGFGMRKQGLPADHWIDRFGEWLAAQGFMHDTQPPH